MWNPQSGYVPMTWQGLQRPQEHPQVTVTTPVEAPPIYQQPHPAVIPQMGVYHQPPLTNPNVGWDQPRVDSRLQLPWQQHSNHFVRNVPRQPPPPGVDRVESCHVLPGHFIGPAIHNPTPRIGFGDGSVRPSVQVPCQPPNRNCISNSASFNPAHGLLPNTPACTPGSAPLIPSYTATFPQFHNPDLLSEGNPPLPGRISSDLPITNQVSHGYVGPITGQISQPPAPNYMPANCAPPLPSEMYNPPPPPLPESRGVHLQNSSWGNSTSSSQSVFFQQSLLSSSNYTSSESSSNNEVTKHSQKPDMHKSKEWSKSLEHGNHSPRTHRKSASKNRRDFTIVDSKTKDRDKRSPNKTHHRCNSGGKSRSSREEQVSPRKRSQDVSPSSQDRKKIRHGKETRHDETKTRTYKGTRSGSSTQSEDGHSNSSSRKSDGKYCHQDEVALCDSLQSTTHSSKRTNSILDVKGRQKKDKQEPVSKSKPSSSREHVTQDLPLRCVSPPPPEVNRVIKFLVPEEYYQLSKHPKTLKTITNATKKLEELYGTFESTVLTTEDNQEILSKISEYPDKIPKESENQEEDNLELQDLLDGSDYEIDEENKSSDSGGDTLSTNDDSDESDDDENDDDVSESSTDEDQGKDKTSARQRKLADPRRLHPDIWFNENGEGNDGPVCKCCSKAKLHGIRHAIYPDEKDITLCEATCNNAHKLYHYWVTITPHCNFMTERPTLIRHKDKDFIFEGFSLISHQSLDKIPLTSFIRFNIEYSIYVVKEPMPKNFCIRGLELFSKFLFSNILELLDWTLKGKDKKGCPMFHFLPRFIYRQQDKQDGKEVHELLSMDKVLSHLIKNSSEELIKPDHLTMSSHRLKTFGKSHSNNIVRHPLKKPAAFRIDDILFSNNNKRTYPVVIHHGIRPMQMSFSGNGKYQKLWKSYKKLRNTLANKPVTSRKDHDRLIQSKVELEKMRLRSSMRRDAYVRISSQGLRKTGINSDICQHAMVLPVLVHHLRYHLCLKSLALKLGYQFKDFTLLQLALTHPSYHMNFGMNPDQARNTLSNCGVKHPRYGDRRIHQMHTKKKGITNLIRIMANLGKIEENQSMIRHNERLEFLGDAVLEFICSSHLFFMLPDESEGHLAIFRSALVQNSQLAAIAKSFNLSDYMQYSHGPDLCKEEDMNHAMANCFEAILGAVFLESGLKAATDLFTKMAFQEEKLRKVWIEKNRHPLQTQQPDGDRHLIPSSPVLQKLQELEKNTGIVFTHIRLLARAFTHPQVGFNNLTLGDNQRLEFLGDSVLQLVISLYLYRHFPEHHEGHLSLLRSSLVNNRAQADISRQLGLEKYINFGSMEVKNVREKLLADVLEAYIAAIYIDKGLQYVETFCRVCFFPRIEDNIINQEWIDSKSQLQQCCLALREEHKSPDLPVYKVLQDAGPSHNKKFQVGVYYKGKRCGTGEGKSVHQAEMAAAKDALDSSYFPELARQKHLLDEKHQERRTRRHQPPTSREERPGRNTPH